VDVDDTHRSTRAQAALDEVVVLGQVAGVKGAAKLVVDQVLPSDRETERIEAVVGDEVLHLGNAGSPGRVGGRGGAGAIGSAAEIEAGNVHAGEADLAAARA